jgi:drug/metabolite transporter (DMT)-like permease
LLVMAIRASSIVVVKIGLTYLGPLTSAGLRYSLAFLLLLPLLVPRVNATRTLPRSLWARLILIGISSYTLASGALTWGLVYIPATMSSVLMSLIPLVVLVTSVIWLNEVPSGHQLLGVAICVLGSGLYFSPGLQPGQPVGIAIVLFGVIGYALFAVLGRQMARDHAIDTLTLTAIPLAVGGASLLVIALPLEGLPTLSATAWAIVLWLALVNTALANLLYNHALRALTALEMSVMLNLAPLVTALLAWLVLQESITEFQIAGLAIVVVGVMLVQQSATRLFKARAV